MCNLYPHHNLFPQKVLRADVFYVALLVIVIKSQFLSTRGIFFSLIFHASLLINRGHTGPGIASSPWLLLPKSALWGKKGWGKVHTHGSKGTTGRKCFSCCLVSNWLEVTCWATRGFTPLVPSRGHFISCINIWGHLFSVSFLLYTITSGVKWLQEKHKIFNLGACSSCPC